LHGTDVVISSLLCSNERRKWDDITEELARGGELANQTDAAARTKRLTVVFTTGAKHVNVTSFAGPIIRAESAKHATSHSHGICGTECANSCSIAGEGYQPVKVRTATGQIGWQTGPLGKGSTFTKTWHGVSP
jgi:hypothetical protein